MYRTLYFPWVPGKEGGAASFFSTTYGFGLSQAALGPSCLAHDQTDQTPGASGLSHGLRHSLEENPVLPVHIGARQIMTTCSHEFPMGSEYEMHKQLRWLISACHQSSTTLHDSAFISAHLASQF